MTEPSTVGLTRRDFVGQAALLAGAVPLLRGLFPGSPSAVAGRASPYAALTPDDASFTEALVNALCPADRLTPSGVQCGLAAFIDDRIGGEFGRQPSSQPGRSRKEFFRSGIAAANQASRQRFGVTFDQLSAADAGIFLSEVAGGRMDGAGRPLSTWYREIIDPLLVEASLSGPLYQRYGNSVFRKLFP